MIRKYWYWAALVKACRKKTAAMVSSSLRSVAEKYLLFLRHTRSGAREATNVFSAFSYQKKSTLAKELKKSTFFSAFAERFFGHTMVHWKFISSGKLLNLKATHAKKPLWIILETCSQKELCDWNMLHKHWTFWVISTQRWSCQKGNTTSD